MTGAPIKLTDRILYYTNKEEPQPKGFFNKVFENVGKKLWVKEKNPESRIYNSFMPAQKDEEIEPRTLIDYAKKTPQLDLAVESLVELIVGVEININSDDEEAKKLLEDFSYNINLYDRLKTGVRDELITGDAVFEKVNSGGMVEKIEEIDPLALWDVEHDKYGNVYNYILQTQDGEQKIPASKCIHFKFKQVGKEFWGRSMFHSLAVSRTVGNRTTRPMIEQVWAMEDAMTGTFVNHAYPMMMINYKNVNDEQLEKEARKIKDWKPGDKLIQSTSDPPTVDIYESSTVGKYESYVKHIAEILMMGTGFSYEIFLGNFTSRASSETTDNVTMKKVRAHQKYLANKIKTELFREILMNDKSGKWKTPESFNKANINITFETGNVKDLTVADVKERVASGMWTREEGREWDKNNTGSDLFDDDKILDDSEEIPETPKEVEQEALKTYKMVQEEIKKDRIVKRAKEIKKKIKK